MIAYKIFGVLHIYVYTYFFEEKTKKNFIMQMYVK